MPTIRSLARTALLIAGLLPGISARTADADSLFDWGLPLARKDSVEGVGPFWAVPFTKKLVEAGDTLWVVSRLDIAAHHYAYAEKTSASIGEIDGVWVGEAIASLPEIKFDRFQNREVPQYVGSAVYRIPLVPAAAVAPRELTAQLTLRTMGCSETVCYLQMSEERTVTFEYVPPSDTDVEGSGFTKLGADEPGATGLGGMLAERGMLLALGLMFLGGLLTSFTPCVYPVIPFTISFFGASRAGALRGFALSGVFVLGMATMYSALGVAAAATGAVFGTVMSNPIVIGVIAALFLAFAASMFGAFKIQLGGSAQKRLESVGGASIGGAFLAGLVAGVIAAPCTGPVLGSALAYVATTGDLVFGFFSMFAFALGMGMLFMAIGTFSANIVPKSGPWLDKVESAFGIVMISAALYFLKDVVPPLKEAMVLGNTALIVSLLLVAAGIALGAIHLSFVAGYDREQNRKPPTTVTEKTRKAVGILLAVAGIYGAVGSFVAPPAAAHGGSISEPGWVYDETAGLEIARAQGKPVLIDAYADWCAACLELDRYTYSDSTVLARLEGFVTIKLDFTEMADEEDALAAKYGITGLPTVIILDAAGDALPGGRFAGFLPPDEFIEFLNGIAPVSGSPE